jgi:hypothetical protein
MTKSLQLMLCTALKVRSLLLPGLQDPSKSVLLHIALLHAVCSATSSHHTGSTGEPAVTQSANAELEAYNSWLAAAAT